MNKYVLVLAIFCFITGASGQQSSLKSFDPDSYGWGDRVFFKPFDGVRNELPDAISVIRSPSHEREIRLIEESDLTVTPYDQSFAKAVIVEDGTPIITIEINRYKTYEFKWLNEEVLFILYSPSRCWTFNTIFDVFQREVLYERGFGHCGV